MKLTGKIRTRKATPAGLELTAEVEGVPGPLRLFLPKRQSIDATGDVIIDIPENAPAKPEPVKAPAKAPAKAKGKK